MDTEKHSYFDLAQQTRRRDLLDLAVAIVAGVLIWAIIIAGGLALFVSIAGAETIIARDRLGREIYSTTRTRSGVAVRDRFGREVLTTQGRQK